MRPPRVAILVLFFSASLFLFCRSISSIHYSNALATSTTNAVQSSTKSGFRSFFSVSTPFTLFPPNAAISLTDDNSTSFPARPAAFGPPLPTKGLSGQLWIGSGFADDNLPEGEGEGELGCTDVPGWEDGGLVLVGLKGVNKGFTKALHTDSTSIKSKNSKRNFDTSSKDPVVDPKVAKAAKAALGGSTVQSAKYRPFDDGTDDYLHQGLQSPPRSRKEILPSGTTHADIQSIQETAEITGKVVLLSRGGCGFLEKVKWAQRRGAVAVIVGDNTKGGPLIQMFARGDTSNVTIPAIFTSHTTAHLLSSLMQPGSFIEDIIDESGNAVVKIQQSDKARKHRKLQRQQATAATTTAKFKTTTPQKSQLQTLQSHAKPVSVAGDESPTAYPPSNRGWFSSLFSWGSGSGTSRRPNDWVLVDDWSDEKDTIIRTSLEKASKKGNFQASRQNVNDFQAGIQDWRDPGTTGNGLSPEPDNDAGEHSKDDQQSSLSSVVSPKEADATSHSSGITPGSGEYIPSATQKTKGDEASGAEGSGGLMTKLFGDDDGTNSVHSEPYTVSGASGGDDTGPGAPVGREGLWVTITPTSSASPFFDTLLVLVISPLITLSVVYALLILRARIRRRRWRAPKSVIERLPVRTYHTVAITSPSMSPRLPSPTSVSPNTPLLQQPQPQHPFSKGSSSSATSRPRPRSRTTTGVPDSGPSLLGEESDLHIGVAAIAGSGARSPSRTEQKQQERSKPSSEWKKYMGRQVECVVCLEEYVDGVSRVMSLPCGHEFHAECITPWLTTRRRTCPICKGDVVRSLARGAPTGPRYEPYHDNSDEEDGNSAADATAFNRPASPPAQQRQRDPSDLERGILPEAHQGRRRPQTRGGGWINALASSFGVVSGGFPLSRSAMEARDDRSR